MDETEDIRREEMARLASEAAERTILEGRYGKVWDTQQIRDEFEVIGFMAPFVVAKRKSDGVKGSIQFQHSPRFYFNWQEDK